jgi:predicted Zn-dependent protease
MTLAETRSARPLRIKIVTVKRSDTVERLGRRMAGGDHAIDRFRALNGLPANAKLKPGDLVKLVHE